MHVSLIRKTLLSVALLAGTSAFAEPTTWTLKPDQSPVTFVATGKPGFLKIRGEGAHASGSAKLDGNKLEGTFEVALKEFKTGIDLRDEHMHGKYLESEKFPTATLKLDPLTVDAAAGEKDYDFTGKLTIKGVEKPVSGQATVAFSGSAAKGKASFKVKLDDYPVGVPSHLGVTVADSVQVELEFSSEKRTDIAQKP